MTTNNTQKTSARAGIFAVVGICLTIINFATYTILARTIFDNNELLWLVLMISNIITTFAAYFLHSRITWKERRPTKLGIINFFAWNFATAIIISPLLTKIFQLLTPFYQFIFNISSDIGFSFDYKFIESTAVFGLVAAITMILNFLFYDRLVFGTNNLKTKLSNDQ